MINMEKTRNIYCVGRNYVEHVKELHNKIPDKPMLFSKPTHSLVMAEGQSIRLPGESGEVHFEAELVLHIGQAYEKGISVDELVDLMTIGIDFTLRDVQNELKRKGHPWLLAKGFLNSAVIGPFFSFPGEEACKQIDFSLSRNDRLVQQGNIKNLIFDLQTLIDYTAEHFGLGQGDLIFTGTPEGVGPALNGDHFFMQWGEEAIGSFHVRM